MNDITRCPNCQTAFRVTEAQLQAHKGKVRCGRCSFVFNARECIEAEPPQATAVIPAGPAEISPQPAAELAPPAIPATDLSAHSLQPSGERIKASLTEDLPADSKLPSPPSAASTKESLANNLPADSLLPPPPSATRVKEPPREDFTVDMPSPQRPKRIVAEAADPVDFSAIGLAVNSEALPETTEPPVMDTEPEAEPEAEPVTQSGYRPIYTEDDSLLLPAPPVSKWQWVFGILAVILGLTLAGQMIYQQRTAISMELPWLRPKLITACQALGCTMPLPQNSELLRSEWSELSYVPEFPNIIQLNATLRNLAQYEQALPLLEVTLTDDQERVVLKKVFKPSEYLISQEKNRRQFNAQDDLRAFLQIDLGELHSTAYSIYWFYP